jgi:rare lipoprotein A
VKRSSRTFWLILLICGSTGACERHRYTASNQIRPHYTLGPPWQSDGYWFYPIEESSYDATGLAVIDVRRTQAWPVTADGEPYDPAVPAAAHQTLQLPVVLHVRNLENGLEIVLRVNDRGPASLGRLLSLTPRAAQLLRMVPGQSTRVHVVEDERLSRLLLLQLDGAPVPDVVAAPVAAVQEQSLMPGGNSGGTARDILPPQEHVGSDPSKQLGEAITMGAADPGRLWIDAGHFNQPGYARHLAALLAGAVRQEGRGRSSSFSVRVGPFDLTADADAALDRARSAGVTGARIIVE